MLFKKILSIFLSLMLFSQQTGFAQTIALPGILPPKSVVADFRSPHLRYISFSPDGSCGFLLDREDAVFARDEDASGDVRKCFTYFLTGLRLPPDRFWVNLRPDSPDKIIDPLLERTEIGRVMLEADVQLKKDLARLTSPECPEGKVYWDKLYAKARSILGTPDNNFPAMMRPWIVPGEVFVRDTGTSVYVYKATLAVRLEADHLQEGESDPRMRELNLYSAQLARELILPKLELKVNSSGQYAELRKAYFSLVLAQWFRLNSKRIDSPYIRDIDNRSLEGLESTHKWSARGYYEQYRDSFKKGEYNVSVRGQNDGRSIRIYSSGGILPYPAELSTVAGTGPVWTRENEIPFRLDPGGELSPVEHFSAHRDGGSLGRGSENISVPGKLRRVAQVIGLSVFLAISSSTSDRPLMEAGHLSSVTSAVTSQVITPDVSQYPPDPGVPGATSSVPQPVLTPSVPEPVTAPDVSAPTSTVPSSQPTPTPTPPAEFTLSLAQGVDQQLVNDAMVTLSSFSTRYFGSLDNRAAGDFIAKSLQSFGYQENRILDSAPYYIRAELDNGIPLYYAAVIKGKQEAGAVIITAHFDSVYAGADDNASGVAALLGLAQVYAYSHPERTVYIVFANGEEFSFGSLGTKVFIRDLIYKEKQVPADCLVFDIDSIAQPDITGRPQNIYAFPLDPVSETKFPLKPLKDAVAPYDLLVDQDTEIREGNCDAYQYARYRFPSVIISSNSPKDSDVMRMLNGPNDVLEDFSGDSVAKTAAWLRKVISSAAGFGSADMVRPYVAVPVGEIAADYTDDVRMQMESYGLKFSSDGDFGISESGYDMIVEWLEFMKERFPGYTRYLTEIDYGHFNAIAHAEVQKNLVQFGIPFDTFPVYANFIDTGKYGWAYYSQQLVLIHEIGHIITNYHWKNQGRPPSCQEVEEFKALGYDMPFGNNLDELVVTDLAYMLLYGKVIDKGTFTLSAISLDQNGQTIMIYNKVNLAETAQVRKALVLKIFGMVGGVNNDVTLFAEPDYPSQYIAPLPVAQMSAPDISTTQDLVKIEASALPPQAKNDDQDQSANDGGSKRPGGVDFRYLEQKIRTLGLERTGAKIGFVAAPLTVTKSDLIKLRRMIACGIEPRPEFITACLKAGGENEDWQSYRAALRDCIAGLLRNEERENIVTSENIKQLLSCLDSKLSRQEVLIFVQ